MDFYRGAASAGFDTIDFELGGDHTDAREKKAKAHYLEAALMFVGLATLAYFTFVVSGRASRPTFLYSLVPSLLWPALRFGIMGTSNSIVLVAFLAIFGAVHDRGPFTGDTPVHSVLSLQLFLLVASVLFMVLAAVVEVQKAAEQGPRLRNQPRNAGRLGPQSRSVADPDDRRDAQRVD